MHSSSTRCHAPQRLRRRHRPQLQALEARELLATIGNNLARGDQLFHYRIAIAATGEYTQHFGGVAGAQQAIETAIDQLNELFEAELSLHLDLVTGTETIFTDPATDPYTYNDIGAMKGQNQATLDSIVGSANYDVGHVFGKRPSGWAGGTEVGSVGEEGQKARGATNSSGPQGTIWIKALAHEIGHQFFGRHTFNGTAGGCTSGSKSPLAAYEPGSGTTIMSYAGSCDTDNVGNGRDPYYHAANFEDIQVYTGNLAGNTPHGLPYSTSSTGNQIPLINGGNDYAIPARTPFELTASATDADDDPLTYTWEQLDLGPGQPLGSPDNGSSPLFRSFPPASDPVRIFPKYDSILHGTPSQAETLPSTDRFLNFRTTVRDGRGGVNSDDVLLTVIDAGVPFSIASPAASTIWSGGTTQTVSWNVAGTTAAPINTSLVRFRLSTDSGATFPFDLGTTANDGSHDLQIPNLETTTARLKIEPVGNVYFAINSGDFTISQNPSLAAVNLSETGFDTRAYEGGTDDTYTLALSKDPGGVVDLQIAAGGQALVSLDGVNFAASQTIRFDSTAPATVTVRAIDDTVEEGRHESLLEHEIVFSTSPDFSPATLVQNLTVYLVDDELPPVAGVDFDWFASSSADSPENWAENPWYGYSNYNLLRDDGMLTNIDLSYVQSGSGYAHTAPLFSESVPRHDPPLQQLSGYSRRANYIIATFQDLIPGREYGVYVFGVTHTGFFISQNVTISGATTLPTFTQTMSDRYLQINDEQGSSSRTLQSYEKVAVANAQGRIVIDVRPVSSGQGASLGGLAIRELPQAVPPAEVVGRHLFYNDSAFDGDATASPADDAAIAPDKTALLPGQMGGFTNYSSDDRGITGVMVDISNLASAIILQASDFRFRVGTGDPPSTWPQLLTMPSISVRPGAGVAGSDRVTLIWPEGLIRNRWLQVTVKATPATGLTEDDVFYFGNAVGETGGTPGDTQVNATDFAAVRSAPHTFLNPAAVDNPFDMNRDGRVNALDLLIVRENMTTIGFSLPLWPALEELSKSGVTASKELLPPKEEQAAGLGGAEPLWDTALQDDCDWHEDLGLAAAIESVAQSTREARKVDWYAALLASMAK